MSRRTARQAPGDDRPAEPVAIDILVEAGGWPSRQVLAETARRAVAAAISVVGRAALPAGDIGGEICIVFADDATIRLLNKRWRSRDEATNVLSFAQDGRARQAGMLGDIVLAQETVAREAALEGKLLNQHIAHMVVHGFLHLLGYNHQDDEDAEIMEDLERRALETIGIADPYACAGTQDD